MNTSQNRMLYLAIMSLKRQYGNNPIEIYTPVSQSVNLATGDKSESVTVNQIEQAIVLPERGARALVQTISKISADKQFVYGGTFDRSSRIFIFDKTDVPDLELGLSNWIVYRDRRWNIKSFDEFEIDSLWVVQASEVAGVRPRRVFHEHVTDYVRVRES